MPFVHTHTRERETLNARALGLRPEQVETADTHVRVYYVY